MVPANSCRPAGPPLPAWPAGPKLKSSLLALAGILSFILLTGALAGCPEQVSKKKEEDMWSVALVLAAPFLPWSAVRAHGLSYFVPARRFAAYRLER